MFAKEVKIMERKHMALFVISVAALMLGSAVFALTNTSIPSVSADQPAPEIKSASCGVDSCATSGCSLCGQTDGKCGCGCGK